MSDTTVPAKKAVLTDKQYNLLKWVALVGLPALGALYFGLAPLWGLPKAEEIVGTITLVDTCLGLMIGVAKKNFDNSDDKYDGTLEVLRKDTRLIHQLEIATPPEQLGNKDSITLKVSKVDHDIPDEFK